MWFERVYYSGKIFISFTFAPLLLGFITPLFTLFFLHHSDSIKHVCSHSTLTVRHGIRLSFSIYSLILKIFYIIPIFALARVKFLSVEPVLRWIGEDDDTDVPLTGCVVCGCLDVLTLEAVELSV